MRFNRSVYAAAAAIAVVLTAAGCDSAGTTNTEAPGSTPTSTGAATTSASASTSAPAPVSATATGPAATASPASPTPTPTEAAESQGGQAAATGTALAGLESLAVQGRAPKTGYDRDQFGPAWADVNSNGCDTRNDILVRDLTEETFKPGTRDCVVATGVLDDPYTATEIHFARGQDTSEDVPVDHVVALGDAWQKGAQQLSLEARTAFANDPLNLLAVHGPANAQKSDSDAASWLPPNRSFRCDYVARQIAVKAEYELWVTAAEKTAMAEVLTDCPDQLLPGDGQASEAYEIDTRSTQTPTPAPTTQASRTQAPAPVPTTQAPRTQAPRTQAPTTSAPAPTVSAPQQAGTDPRFSSCAKAKAAGYGPYLAGTDPEYDWYRDGDSDGINCE